MRLRTLGAGAVSDSVALYLVVLSNLIEEEKPSLTATWYTLASQESLWLECKNKKNNIIFNIYILYIY